MLKATPLSIPDVILLASDIFTDHRGFFFESYNSKNFYTVTGLHPVFVQDNHSCSSKGILRGLHYQITPKNQAKLVRVVHGSILDVAVDIRKNSPTFGCYVKEILSAENKKQLWIPENFAHGFLTLSDRTEVLYKTTQYYDKDLEYSVFWNDPKIGIEWGIDNLSSISLSKKDSTAPCLDAIVF